MIYFVLFIVSVIITLILNFYNAEKVICKPPNEFVQVFAPPGTGKTTLAAKIVREATMSGKVVYSNVPIIGARKFDIKHLGKFKFKDCILIIDEAGSKVGNRDWHNNLNSSQIKFLKEHRHYNVDIYLFSQAYGDVDNKFRELTTKLIMLKKSKIPFCIRACAIKKCMDLIGGQICEYYEWDKNNSFRFFNPKLWAYFNSYQIEDDLPQMREFYCLKSETM